MIPTREEALALVHEYNVISSPLGVVPNGIFSIFIAGSISLDASGGM